MPIYEIILAVVVAVAGVTLSVGERSPCGGLLLHYTYKRQMNETDTVHFTGKGVTICTEGRCGNIKAEKLLCSYPSIFTSVEKYTKTTGLPYRKKIKEIPEQNETEQPEDRTMRIDDCDVDPEGDGDYYCPTHLYATYYVDETNNTSAEACIIVHLTYLDNFQMVSEGICGPCGSCNDDPLKSCQQMYTAQSLLAWNKVTHALRFEMFNIPTYCSCINGI